VVEVNPIAKVELIVEVDSVAKEFHFVMVELDLVLVRLDLRTTELISAVATLSRQSPAPVRIFFVSRASLSSK
jgi:hypothetical protein